MVAELLQSVSHVDELVIGSDPIQVLSLLKLWGAPSPLFRNCKHVTVTSCMWKFDLPGIICLLDTSPHLETLLIKVVRWKDDVPLPQVRELFEKKKAQLHTPYGKILHLKTVKIDYPQENMYTERGGLAIATYILKRAVVLQKLILFSSSGSSFCRPRIVKSSESLSNFLTRNKVAWELKEINGRFEFSFPKSI